MSTLIVLPTMAESATWLVRAQRRDDAAKAAGCRPSPGREKMEQQSMRPTTRARRHDRLLHERVHDPYQLKRTLPEPTVCPRCGAVYHQGRWTWMKRPTPAREDMCPACQRVRDQYPGGFLPLGGRFVQEHEEEILNLVHHEEQDKNADPPCTASCKSRRERTASASPPPTFICRAASARRCTTPTRERSAFATAGMAASCACIGGGRCKL